MKTYIPHILSEKVSILIPKEKTGFRFSPGEGVMGEEPVLEVERARFLE